MKILIAEDDFTSRSILSAVLKKCGFDPVVAEDGNAAWKVLQGVDAPRLLLLDWSMPGIDGLEICRRLREKDLRNPPYIILLTARDQKSDIVLGLEAGANDYVAKPYDNEELQARIRVGQRMLELQTYLVDARDALEHQATHDFLTGLLNRRAILEKLRQEISRAGREQGNLSVGMFDIDHFKNINDSFGHQAGDEALIAFSLCLQNGLREYDSVGRYGGEEFLVITTGPIGMNFESLFERLRARVAEAEIKTNEGTTSLTVSVGVASGTGRSTVDALLVAADAALYQAKAEGRNRVAYAVPGNEGVAGVRTMGERGDDDGRKRKKETKTRKKGRGPGA
jgi:two-component system, cell cycle response regulator